MHFLADSAHFLGKNSRTRHSDTRTYAKKSVRTRVRVSPFPSVTPTRVTPTRVRTLKKKRVCVKKGVSERSERGGEAPSRPQGGMRHTDMPPKAAQKKGLGCGGEATEGGEGAQPPAPQGKKGVAPEGCEGGGAPSLTDKILKNIEQINVTPPTKHRGRNFFQKAKMGAKRPLFPQKWPFWGRNRPFWG